MKIELRLNNDTLIACNQLLQTIYNESTPTETIGKIVKSICFDVADKLDSKRKTVVKKASLFDQKKQYKITLKYHEAWGLFEALQQLNKTNNNDYKRTIVQKVIDTLHQKLS